MKISDVKYVDIISTSEDEHGFFDMITSYNRLENKTYQRTYSINNSKTTICKYCGTWNFTAEHECELEYVSEDELIEEVNELQNDSQVKIYINKTLI